MTEQYIGEIRAFGFNFAPQNWALCAGQTLPINTNQALFSLLGTMYGGDGRTNFALPDLRGRSAVGAGQGSGLSNYDQGQAGGSETVTLTAGQVAPHTHPASGSSASSSKSPAGALPGYSQAGSAYGSTADAPMSSAVVGPNAGGEPHPNLPPYLAINWCIALEGIYPPRN